ncbi:phosphotransferase [Paenibacillus sp. FSL R7-0345]|uniref:phosphotransferase enzyme family protein n=1 Tax=Paenibacillus sp. FSL R7-0345 TaxID=2954535 RepID=UPI003159AF49
MNRTGSFNNEILKNAVRLFNTSSIQTSYLGGSQNIVYEYQQGGESYILRLTPSCNRTVSLVQSELDWIRFLANEGISVSEPILSKNDQFTEVIQLPDGYYTCVLFEKAQGRKVGYPECLQDNNLYEQLGRLTGKLHALSQTYIPQDGIVKRHDWSQNWFLQNIDLLPESQVSVRKSCYSLVNTIKSLKKDKNSYGLIHGDINIGNYRVDEQRRITLFDFDEAQYSWFVEDIAIQLYYLVYVFGGEDGKGYREEQAQRFMNHFMQGYTLEHSLDECWLKQIPLFLRLRELIVYIGSFRNWDGDETFSSSDNQWLKDWIAESKWRIENEIPVVNIWGG